MLKVIPIVVVESIFLFVTHQEQELVDNSKTLLAMDYWRSISLPPAHTTLTPYDRRDTNSSLNPKNSHPNFSESYVPIQDNKSFNSLALIKNDPLEMKEDFNPVLFNYANCMGAAVCNETMLLPGKTQPHTAMSCYYPTCGDCRCDADCHTYGDCCPDIYTQSEIAVKCEAFDGDIAFGTFVKGFWVVHTCPSTFPYNEVRRQCEEPDADILDEYLYVTDPSTNKTFINKFCAACNYVTKTVVWGLKLSCVNSLDKTSVNNQNLLSNARGNGCDFARIKPEWYQPRVCYAESHVVMSCSPNVSDSRLINLCETGFTNYALAKYVIYKNIFCAMCNGFSIDLSLPCMDMHAQYGQASRLNTPFTLILDIRSAEEPETLSDCPPGHLLHPIQATCIELRCPPDRFLVNDTECSNLVTFSNTVRYNVGIRFSMQDNRDMMPWSKEFWTGLIRHIQIYLNKYVPGSDIDLLANAFGPNDKTLMYVEVNLIVLPSRTRLNLDDIEQDLLLLQKDEFVFYSNKTNMFYNFTASPSRSSVLDSGMISHHEDQSAEQYNLNKTPIFFLLDQYSYRDLQGSVESRLYADSYYVTPLLRCARIEITGDSFAGNNSRGIDFHGRYLFEGEYFKRFNDSYIEICANIFLDIMTEVSQDGGKTRTPTDQAIQIISQILIYLSNVCLIISFLTYCLFKSLRSLPGQNNMALIFHLCLAQMCTEFLHDVSDSTICMYVGIIIHYLWLTTFGWVTVCCFHMFRLFRNSFSRSTQVFRFWKYALFVNGTSVVCIVVVIAVTLVLSDWQDIGYGGRGRCYLSSALHILFGTVLPLFVVVVSNIVMFAMTLRAMSKAERVDKHCRSHKGSVILYCKMSTVTGLFWTLTLVNAFVDMGYFSIVVVLLNCLQGILIFVSFICNRRVAKLYKMALARRLTKCGFDVQMDKSSKKSNTRLTASTSL